MIRVLGCIFQQHDLKLVLVAAGLCTLACATALAMITRARAADQGKTRLIWLAGAGAVAGFGIWATHFVAMLAYQTGLPIAFVTGLTILSAAIAMVLCGAGFALALRPWGAVAGGMVIGLSISAMHYTGMAALELPARAVWDLRYVAASLLIGASLTGFAMHVASRRRTRADYALGAALFVAAIVGMHFTAMSAVAYVPESAHPINGAVIAPFALAVVVASGAAFIVALALIVALVDRYLEARAHGEALRMRQHIAELENTQMALKKASDDLLVALGEAAEASKAKSEFLASMSHELRTPLNAVIGFSDAMVMEMFGPLSERYKSYASDIRGSGAHLLALINDVLDLSRLDAGKAELHEEVFDPVALIVEAVRMLECQAEKAGLKLATDVAPGLPPLKADKRRIKQILVNLVSNAVKFTPSGGRVRVTARQGEKGLVLAVADTGIGIAPEDLPKVLEVFGQIDSSLSRKHEGSGLGLPLAKQLAELHGGTLTLESRVNAGTTVTVTLPPERLVMPNKAAA